MALSPSQIEIIQSNIPVIREHGKAITTHFYETLLTEVPSLHNVFNQANQVDGHQATALDDALYTYATHIQNVGSLSPALRKIYYEHASLFVRREQYEVVGEYFLGAMRDVLGNAFTQDVHDAWAAAYWQLPNLMIAREEELMASTNGWTDWRTFKNAQKTKESDEITSLYFKPIDGQGLPEFNPGQYVNVLVFVPQFRYLQSRQYSLSDAPGKDYYRISVKKERGLKAGQSEDRPGYVSNVLHDEKDGGDSIQLSYPFGELFLHPREESNRPLVLLSAGVGITPMVSILNTVVQSGNSSPISVIQAARSTAVQAFGTHIQRFAKENKNMSYTRFIKSPSADDIADQHYEVLW